MDLVSAGCVCECVCVTNFKIVLFIIKLRLMNWLIWFKLDAFILLGSGRICSCCCFNGSVFDFVLFRKTNEINIMSFVF